MENLNIAEILKDCPKGMKLDCTMWDNCTFEGIEDVGHINILIQTPNGQIKLSKEGCFSHNCSGAKCVIFPKGKTTWEGFVPPCKFKVGDKVLWNYDTKIPRTISKVEFTLNRGCVYWIDVAGCSSGWWAENELTPIPSKFDITTLKPFDMVLVRLNKDNQWGASFFSHVDEYIHSHCYKFVTTSGKSYPYCIPYEENKHLLGTTDDCEEFYKTWE